MPKKKVADLREGDLVDLEGDPFADPKRNKPEYQFEYATVVEYELESPDCMCIYFESTSVGFPPDHMVEVP